VWYPWSLPVVSFIGIIFCAGAQIVSSILSGWLVWLWMHVYHADIIKDIRRTYNVVVVNKAHYWLVLTILLVNALIGTSFVQVYYRVYFV
jgi:hypothetical protein